MSIFNQNHKPEDDEKPKVELKIMVDEEQLKEAYDSMHSKEQKPPVETPVPDANADDTEVVPPVAAGNEELIAIGQKVENIETLLQDFTYKDKINKELHDELQVYRTGLRKEIITPLLKHIIREYNRANKQYRFYLQREQEAPQGELFGKLLKEFDMIAFALLELLNDYGIDAFEAKEGEPYFAKEQKIIGVVETDDNAKNGTVASCETCGFRDVDSERLLFQAEVKIYKNK
ncbi:MAG: nucleotide exchange factor GrpE [Bacteroidales bacterium]|jgi:molecular chaperone GrpE (heat shock protein)|nr:nucleotide exchange factor GrpE [Bacteroidales bacterium]